MNKNLIEKYLSMTPEVQSAIEQNQPVVALESTIISHGMPYPQNVETALAVEAKVIEHGAVPATIGILNGRLHAGLNHQQIEQLGKSGLQSLKVSRRDIPFALLDDNLVGATTVAATMIVAELAGIRVFATGGIGGVHRGASDSFDISADLQELANTSVAVVCAGAKSILDIALTREYLETYGVPVIGYDTDCWPAFYTRRTEHMVDYNFKQTDQIARALANKWALGLDGGAVICVPVPREFEQDEGAINGAIESALEEMRHKGITGKDTTPFLLGKIADITAGSSLQTNIQLVLNNAGVAANIAKDLIAANR